MISNILEQEDIIKGLPDAALQKEARAPSGALQQFLVVSEIKRRTDMRKSHENQMKEQPQGTVADQIVMEGIAGMMPQQGVGMPPQMGPQMPPQGMPPQGGPQMPPQMPPPGMPPMGMASGGIVQASRGLYTQTPLGGGKTRKDRLDELLESNLSYAQILQFISEIPGDNRDALAYVRARVEGEDVLPSGRRLDPALMTSTANEVAGGMSPADQALRDSQGAQRSSLRMGEGMFGYSDRDAGIMGTMESPLPDREDYPPGRQGRELFGKSV